MFSLVLCLAALAQPATESRAAEALATAANDPEARKLRLEFMKDFRSEFQVQLAANPESSLEALAEPVQRWSNPVRNFFSDGCLFLWLNGQRPAVAATVSIRGNGVVWLETASLSPQALRCLRKGSDYWAPRAASPTEERIADFPPPAETARARLVQMRRLCEQFAVRTEPMREQPTEMRLMPQPVYRYEDAAAGIVDGGLFAFVETTDPEVLLLIEATAARGADAASWRYTFAKMTSRPIVARRGDKIVWSVPGYWLNPRSPSDLYQERQLATYPPPMK